MANCLGLDDDDGTGLLLSLEDAFAVRFPLRMDVETAGDLHAVLRRLGAGAGSRGAGCATAMAFYRVRRALAEASPGADLRPATVLAAIGLGRPRAMTEIVARQTGLRVPVLPLHSWQGLLLVSLGSLTLLTAAVGQWPHLLAAAAAVFLAGVLLHGRDPGRFPRGCKTLGELARSIAALNFATLCAEGASGRDRDVWAAMVEIMSQVSPVAAAEIRPDTILLRRPYEDGRDAGRPGPKA